MVDFGAISGLVSSVQSIGQIAQGMMGLRDTAMIQAKVSELNGIVLSAQNSAMAAQTEQFALLERVRTLEEKIRKMEAWEAEQQRYKLTDFGGGTFAYALKPEMANGEPAHNVCANCYQKTQKSVLQYVGHNSFQQAMYTCTNCNTRFDLGSMDDSAWKRATNNSGPIY